MLFDQFAGIVEREFPQHRKMFDEARIFRIARGEHAPRQSDVHVDIENAKAVMESWAPDEQVIENFRMPFQVVAFEETGCRDSAGKCCAVFEVLSEQTRRMRFGVCYSSSDGLTFGFGELGALPDASMSFGTADQMARLESMTAWEFDGRRIVPIKGSLLDLQRDGILPSRSIPMKAVTDAVGLGWDKARERLLAQYGFDINEMVEHMDSLKFQILCKDVSLSLAYAMVVNTPSEFIVEERPLNCTGEVKNKARILRSRHRPHYIVLKPREIKTRLLGVESDESAPATPPAHSTRCPHERRGHFRRLESERYKNARGQVLWIKAMWIGPQTAVKGKNRYTVLLDK